MRLVTDASGPTAWRDLATKDRHLTAQYQVLGVLGELSLRCSGRAAMTRRTSGRKAGRHGPSGSLLGSWLVKPAIALLGPSPLTPSGLLPG